jgi:hypothetical protein
LTCVLFIAATGGAIGSIIPGFGTLVGAAIGGGMASVASAVQTAIEHPLYYCPYSSLVEQSGTDRWLLGVTLYCV